MLNKPALKDLLWFSIAACAILAFSSIPYWIGNSLQTKDLVFRGIFFDEADYSVHISMMRAGQQGDLLYQMRFTSELNQPSFTRMFYIILGHVGKWINLDAEITYQLARWIFGYLSLFSIYKLCGKLFHNQTHIKAAFFISVIGSGAGWLQLILGAPLKPISPIDFWLIDAYVFFSISLFPSYSFSLALITYALNLFLGYLETGKSYFVIIILLLGVISQVTNPIAFAGVDFAFAGTVLYLLWKNKEIKASYIYSLGSITLAQIPLLIYNFLILDQDPVWSQYTLQHQTLSPPAIFYLWGFAPFWCFAIFGIISAYREKDTGMIAMTTWVIGGFVLAYLPILVQRRFVLGITIPLGILAVYGFSQIFKKIVVKIPRLIHRERLLYFLYILISSISTFYLILGLSLYMRTYPADKFYPRDLEIALEWLDDHATPNAFVLADIRTSQLVAQRTNLKVYLGHDMETLNLDTKNTEMMDYFKGELPAAWIKQTPIQWVIYGPYEKSYAISFAGNSNLEPIYKNNSVTIYKVH